VPRVPEQKETLGEQTKKKGAGRLLDLGNWEVTALTKRSEKRGSLLNKKGQLHRNLEGKEDMGACRTTEKRFSSGLLVSQIAGNVRRRIAKL